MVTLGSQPQFGSRQSSFPFGTPPSKSRGESRFSVWRTGRGKEKIKDRAIDSLTCGNWYFSFWRHSGRGPRKEPGEDQDKEKLPKAKSNRGGPSCSFIQSRSTLLRLCGLWPARLLCPRDSPGKDMGWAAISRSKGSSQPGDQTHTSCMAGRFFTTLPPGKPLWGPRWTVKNNFPRCQDRKHCNGPVAGIREGLQYSRLRPEPEARQ